MNPTPKLTIPTPKGCIMWLANNRVAHVEGGEVTDIFRARGFQVDKGMTRDGWPTAKDCDTGKRGNFAQSGTIHVK